MVLPHILPVGPGGAPIEPVHVRTEVLPPLGCEVLLALVWVRDDVGVLDRADEVHPQIAQIALAHRLPAAVLDLRDGRALVEAGVADLARVLGADVVVEELVAVVVIRVARVGVAKVVIGGKPDHGEEDPDALFPALGQPLARVARAPLGDEQERCYQRQPVADGAQDVGLEGFLAEPVGLPEERLGRVEEGVEGGQGVGGQRSRQEAEFHGCSPRRGG